MKLSDHDRKLLWAKAGNRCSFRLATEVCNQTLTRAVSGADVVIGEECHIIGEKPGSARYLENFPDRETYSNAILLCGVHHTLIDGNDTIDNYPAELLRSMKRSHEAAISTPAQPVVLKDSTFSAEVHDADLAVGLDIARPTTLSNVQANLRASNVGEAYGVRVTGPLQATLAFCESCASPIPGASAGGAPVILRCPKCGKEKHRRP